MGLLPIRAESVKENDGVVVEEVVVMVVVLQYPQQVAGIALCSITLYPSHPKRRDNKWMVPHIEGMNAFPSDVGRALYRSSHEYIVLQWTRL